MRKISKVRGMEKIWRGLLTLVLVVLVGLSVDCFAIVSHAESQGRVTATSANIRKEPSSSSEVVGSTLKDKIISINGQVQGSDGHTWYQTFVNSETLGYIRSDLVEIIDGSTPNTVTPTEPVNPTTPTTPNTTTQAGGVEAVNPVGATVKGDNRRIRSGGSTSNDIITTVSNGSVLTVTGKTSDSSGKTWYQVSFSDNGAEVQGFIREDFVTLSGELTPYVEPEPEVPPADTVPEPDVTDPDPVVTKDYDTELIDGDWYLLDYTKNEQQKIQDIFNVANSNLEAYQAEHKKAESEKVVIIILIFLLVAAASAIAMLIFKIKDMSDDAYFNQVERETLRRRGDNKTQAGSQKVMHTVGTDKSASRPSGTRPAGGLQGQRPAGQKPAGTGTSQGQKPAGARPVEGSQRPQGGRPAGGPQGQRPAGARPGESGQRPQGTRPAGTQGHKPREISGEPGQADRQGSSDRKAAQGQQGWQSKNFMSEDDDEFEFGFLNYDETEGK